MMNASGRFRNRMPRMAEKVSPIPALRLLERIEGSKTLGHGEINPHHDDWDYRKSSGERQVSGCALLRIDDLADEGARAADHAGNNEITKREREGEDRARRDAGDRKRQDHFPEGLLRLRAEICGSLDERARDALHRRLDRQDHVRQPDIDEDDASA